MIGTIDKGNDGTTFNPVGRNGYGEKMKPF
jgi:hypothetical protein